MYYYSFKTLVKQHVFWKPNHLAPLTVPYRNTGIIAITHIVLLGRRKLYTLFWPIIEGFV